MTIQQLLNRLESIRRNDKRYEVYPSLIKLPYVVSLPVIEKHEAAIVSDSPGLIAALKTELETLKSN